MEFLEKILVQKRLEIAKMTDETPKELRKTYSFVQHLRKNGEKIQIIGEVKRASPSQGDINTGVNIVEQAKIYERSGAAAISVLTDEVFFKGNIDDLRNVAAAVKIPVLNKDFILDKKQINRAINSGATIILLITAALKKSELEFLYNYAKNLGLEILVEVHNLEELRIAESINAEIIGVNNRNLKTFVIDLQTSVDLAKEFSTNAVHISESGMRTADDVKMICTQFNAILVGETLMRSENPAENIAEFKVLR
ncbi:MAG: indole-3-glycerol phosphate synthase TrpC [Chitinispirillales bacterium]|jgi:indole-3-glycerol phosphate synthase|nr:indole-3-glycerol phosphate synthase TrpC [Chitinispirillales bacterium]